jgi:hypothetical protein
MIEGRDRTCGTCGRRTGDHTLDEWAKCIDTVSTDLPYEDEPDVGLQKKFGLSDDTAIADNVVVRAATFDAFSGIVRVKQPLLLHDFSVGVPGGPPRAVAKVAFFGNDEGLRKYAQLVAQAAEGALRASRNGRG